MLVNHLLTSNNVKLKTFALPSTRGEAAPDHPRLRPDRPGGKRPANQMDSEQARFAWYSHCG